MVKMGQQNVKNSEIFLLYYSLGTIRVWLECITKHFIVIVSAIYPLLLNGMFEPFFVLDKRSKLSYHLETACQYGLMKRGTSDGMLTSLYWLYWYSNYPFRLGGIVGLSSTVSCDNRKRKQTMTVTAEKPDTTAAD